MEQSLPRDPCVVLKIISWPLWIFIDSCHVAIHLVKLLQNSRAYHYQGKLMSPFIHDNAPSNKTLFFGKIEIRDWETSFFSSGTHYSPSITDLIIMLFSTFHSLSKKTSLSPVLLSLTAPCTILSALFIQASFLLDFHLYTIFYSRWTTQSVMYPVRTVYKSTQVLLSKFQ